MTENDPMTVKNRRAVRERLWIWIKKNYGSRPAVQKAVGLDKTTLQRCLNSKSPSTPSGKTLALLAAKTTLSVDYLLTGEGPESRAQVKPGEDLATALYNYMARHIERQGWHFITPKKHLITGERLLEAFRDQTTGFLLNEFGMHSQVVTSKDGKKGTVEWRVMG